VIRAFIALVARAFAPAPQRKSTDLNQRRSSDPSSAIIRCFSCEGRNRFRPVHYRRIPAQTSLEHFLASRGIGQLHLLHAGCHIRDHFGLAGIGDGRLRSIRKGTVIPSTAERLFIALCVSNILGETIPASVLFEDARRQA
jgi:hypothetical protein